MKYRRNKPHSAPPFALTHRPDELCVATLAVKGYRQARNYCCGFAAVLMVLRHFGRELAGVDLFDALGTARDGTSQSAIVKVLRSEGIGATLRYEMGFEHIVRCIDGGKPLIGYLGDEEHWIVLYGYGRSPERVFVADPEPGKGCEYPWEGYGHRLGGFALVCSGGGRSSEAQETASLARSEEGESQGQLSFMFETKT